MNTKTEILFIVEEIHDEDGRLVITGAGYTMWLPADKVRDADTITAGERWALQSIGDGAWQVVAPVTDGRG